MLSLFFSFLGIIQYNMKKNIFYITFLLAIVSSCGKTPVQKDNDLDTYYLNSWNGVIYEKGAILYLSTDKSINITLLTDIPYCLNKSYIYIKTMENLIFDNTFMDIDAYNDHSECFDQIDLFKIKKQNEYINIYINETILVFKKEI